MTTVHAKHLLWFPRKKIIYLSWQTHFPRIHLIDLFSSRIANLEFRWQLNRSGRGLELRRLPLSGCPLQRPFPPRGQQAGKILGSAQPGSFVLCFYLFAVVTTDNYNEQCLFLLFVYYHQLLFIASHPRSLFHLLIDIRYGLSQSDSTSTVFKKWLFSLNLKWLQVLCETYKYNKKPTETNHRKSCMETMERYRKQFCSCAQV